MSKSQGEFLSPKKLCRALHSDSGGLIISSRQRIGKGTFTVGGYGGSALSLSPVVVGLTILCLHYHPLLLCLNITPAMTRVFTI